MKRSEFVKRTGALAFLPSLLRLPSEPAVVTAEPVEVVRTTSSATAWSSASYAWHPPDRAEWLDDEFMPRYRGEVA